MYWRRWLSVSKLICWILDFGRLWRLVASIVTILVILADFISSLTYSGIGALPLFVSAIYELRDGVANISGGCCFDPRPSNAAYDVEPLVFMLRIFGVDTIIIRDRCVRRLFVIVARALLVPHTEAPEDRPGFTRLNISLVAMVPFALCPDSSDTQQLAPYKTASERPESLWSYALICFTSGYSVEYILHLSYGWGLSPYL